MSTGVICNTAYAPASAPPPSPFLVGQQVVATNGTARIGRICSVGWHRGAREFLFFVEVDGRRVSRRYRAGDLSFAT